ncbi:MAG TPA: alpha/beta hydrolase fold domain-containing protein [Acidobacteriaceae bacterium]|jgi:acetyl esterase/lipase|nr:alpha/beta hydrolase fold domain-containing protein [Acidobacteriaceae bacterium]
MKLLLATLLLFPLCAAAQQGTIAAQAPNTDTSYIDADGTAHITRVLPLPQDLSPEAKKLVGKQVSDALVPRPIEERRAQTDAWQAISAKAAEQIYPVNLAESTIAGVPVRVVTPVADMVPDRVLINLHGGSFNTDSGSLNESIPIANLTRMKVVAVLYRLAPEHPFPAAVDDAVAVYRELLKIYKPEHMALYGTSAGAVMTGEVAVKLKQLGLPLPAALGIFSGMGDFTHETDSWAMFTLAGLAGHHELQETGKHDPYYVGTADPRDPVLSPLYADLHGMPPTLFISSERDALLSGTALLHRAFLRAGDDARLVVFEGLPHAFWYDAPMPESKEADGLMARFFLANLKP